MLRTIRNEFRREPIAFPVCVALLLILAAGVVAIFVAGWRPPFIGA